ncbi:polyprenyl synthetase family protein [Streptomyces morookaense]|uniref:polyprenyl synthetase family protein n=1 Tax=Streptomyces morookaense TaxID=1970 RepID=UPI003402A339
MSTPGAAATTVDPAVIRTAVDNCLASFLDRKHRTALAHRMPEEVARTLDRFLTAGGKRLRPLLCVCGWHAAGREDTPATVVQVAASLEMFHAFALIHDDVMDHSGTRRGKPTIHRAVARHHARLGRRDAQELGVGAAVLIGDLAFAWSDELLHTAGLPPRRLKAVLPLVDLMRTEIMYGQYMDLLATGDLGSDIDVPLNVLHYKTAKYTVERPLHIGATLAGADARTLDVLTAYGIAVGEAFQLRDDLLGAFGTPHETGKSRLDDLREGKHTVLVALALRGADAQQHQIMAQLLGDRRLTENGACRVRDVLEATGARAEVERMILSRCVQAHRALDEAGLPPSAVRMLREIADMVAGRNRDVPQLDTNAGGFR